MHHLERELLARKRPAKNMPEGTGDAGRPAAMPPGRAAEDCHPDCDQDRCLGAYRTPLTLRAPCLSLWEGARGTMVWCHGAPWVAGPGGSLRAPEGLVAARVCAGPAPCTTRRDATLPPHGTTSEHESDSPPCPGATPTPTRASHACTRSWQRPGWPAPQRRSAPSLRH
jgi:hypothetical protein